MISLKIVTPRGRYLEKKVKSIHLTSVEGEMTVLVNHMPIFASSITMLGIALFQTIWECNSRYLVVFIPIMILLAADGFFAWRDYLREERIK